MPALFFLTGTVIFSPVLGGAVQKNTHKETGVAVVVVLSLLMLLWQLPLGD